MSTDQKEIFITEEIPSKNKGEAAILLGMMESLHLAGLKNYKIHMLCTNKNNNDFGKRGIHLLSYAKDIDRKSKIGAVVQGFFYTLNLTSFCFLYWIMRDSIITFVKDPTLKQYIDADVLICGHDGIVEGLENKSNKFNKLITYTFIFYQIILLKIFLQKKICILGASVGPFRNSFTRLLAKVSLNMVDLITVRDPKSYRYLKSMKLKSPLYLTSDFAYLMKPKKVDLKIANKLKGSPLVGFSVSTEFYLFMKDCSNNDTGRYDKYIRIKAEILDYLIEDHDADILFVPHAIKKSKDDRVVARKIFEKMKHQSKCIILEGDLSPEALKYIIGKCDVFIGERTHSNIAATSMCVPGISISEPDSHRNSMFIGLWGKENIIDTDKLDIKTLKALLDRTIKKRKGIRNSLKYRIRRYESSAVKNGLLLKKLIYG